MEKFVRRENGSSEDMDFNDVFGGPPRRFSNQEVKWRYSFGEAEESAEETVLSTPPWSSLNEKPVFGEDNVHRRRHQQGDDFFDDIFRGEDSTYGSPRRTDRDRDSGFGSSPGSRILSPAKPLPPKAEPFGTSVPAQFSLPAKLHKGLELPAFASNGECKMDGSSPNGLATLNSSVSFPRLDEYPMYRQSPLSRGASLRREDLLSTEATVDQKGNVEILNKDKRNVDGIGNQFHFSIYKWAGSEVSMLLPLVGRDYIKPRGDSKCDRSASSNGQIESKMSSHVMKSRGLSTVMSESLSAEVKKEDLRRVEDMKEVQDSVKDKVLHETSEVMPRVNGRTEKKVLVKKEASLRFELKPLHAFLGDETVQLEKKTEKEAPLKKQESLRFELKSLHTFLSDEVDAMEQTEENVPLNKEEPPQSELKSLHAYLNNAVELPVNNMEMKENKNRTPNGIHSSKAVNKNEGTRISSNGVTDQSNLQAAAANSRATGAGDNGVKGKVKEFVQIFNKEADSRPKGSFQRRNLNNKWTANDGDQKENGSATDSADVKEKVVENLNNDEAHPRSPATPTSHTTHRSSTNQKNGFASERLRRDSKIYMENFDDLLEDDFLVQELPDEPVKVTESEDLDDTKAIDAKIRQWSFGKKGNIRSLLSTLQFVLWSDSGWKPVPLADLIESNSVKRAYQKALLRLHPDKLQQKGAAFHQRYVAEKVFDILQDAWDQFNTLVPI
ncbi:J domain-containing protein required for chloroplast accumulation response 1 [Andrographis paniculata]|uniref:J domain-containing protein required for chloroplast accumulation response 1 n=1 Tax=Andrographis paniculata TaxID=175694 RepID=UPI0021E8416F|nr:J domain-containing protein required for chloroplast accumulation response 1 [Andrographis paniculata]XP_051123596.1 J domain-containing protein required for chloroplast accumulation response 1 [Andrographis paniculata]